MKRLTDEEKAQLESLYWEENKTLPEIAEMFGVTYPAIRMWFVKLGIPRRTNSEAQALSNGTDKITPALLRKLYIDQQLSQSQIADLLNRTQTGIGKLLRRNGIQARGKANVGPRNGMYGQVHSPEALAKIKAANLRQFSDPKAREQAAINSARAIAEGKTPKTHTKVETMFATILDSLDIEYIWQYRIKRYVYDFYLSQSNTLVEIHGTFWHADPRFYFWGNLSPTQQRNIINDKRKLNMARSLGYQTTRFWEYDIYNHQEWTITLLNHLV